MSSGVLFNCHPIEFNLAFLSPGFTGNSLPYRHGYSGMRWKKNPRTMWRRVSCFLLVTGYVKAFDSYTSGLRVSDGRKLVLLILVCQG